jgi:hypothetical protein
MLGWEKGEWSQKGREKATRKGGHPPSIKLGSPLYP